MSGRNKKRHMRSRTTNDPNAEEGRELQYLIDLLTPLTKRMGAIKDVLAGGGHSTPPPPETIAIIPIGKQES